MDLDTAYDQHDAMGGFGQEPCYYPPVRKRKWKPPGHAKSFPTKKTYNSFNGEYEKQDHFSDAYGNRT